VRFDGPSLLAGGETRLTCRSDGEWSSIVVGDVGPYFVARDGGTILCPEAPLSEAYEEALLGPALILALALRGTFCLHGSAVQLGTGSVAFLGASGSGKSTLARELGVGSRRRLADDVMPVPVTHVPRVDPRFPQLKLPTGAQLACATSAAVPLAAVYVVAPASPRAEVGVEDLAPAQAVAAIAGQTVAARLFDDELLTAHLGFCRDIVAAVPVRRLVYPRRVDVFPELAALIGREISRGPGGTR
jgi:hypothetical protein